MKIYCHEACNQLMEIKDSIRIEKKSYLFAKKKNSNGTILQNYK